MPTCHDVARYFLAKVDEEVGDVMTHLKLQKLTYYAQGFVLALTGEPLFNEKIEAWGHGPVVPVLYKAFKQYGSNPISPECSIEEAALPFSPEQVEIMNEVNELYGQFSAWKLRDLTHEEPTWIDAYPNGEITLQAMESYFKTLLV